MMWIIDSLEDIEALQESIDYNRIMDIKNKLHPKDLSSVLSSLVRRNFLISKGLGRGTYYELTDVRQFQDDLFTRIEREENSQGMEKDSIDFEKDSIGLEKDSIDFEKDSIGSKRKMTLDELIGHVLKLCEQKPQKISELKNHLDRDPVYLRNRVLKPLILQGKLSFLYPDKPNSSIQAYIVNKDFTE